MKIEIVKIHLVDNQESKRKAYVSVRLDNKIVLNDIVVVEGRKGLFATLPQRKTMKNNSDTSINPFSYFGLNDRLLYSKIIIEAYKKELLNVI